TGSVRHDLRVAGAGLARRTLRQRTSSATYRWRYSDRRIVCLSRGDAGSRYGSLEARCPRGRLVPYSRRSQTRRPHGEARMAQQELHTHQFANGLTLLIEPMRGVQSASFSLIVPAGAVHEQPGMNGTAAVL